MQWQLKPATEIPKHYTMDEADVGGSTERDGVVYVQ